MRYNLSEAARLAGIDRTTLGRHVRSGKVSVGRDDRGQPCIEASELMRAYPAAAIALSALGNITLGDNVTSAIQAASPKVSEGEMELLKELLSEIRRERDDLRRRLDESDSERRQLLRLLSDMRPASVRKAAATPLERQEHSWISGRPENTGEHQAQPEKVKTTSAPSSSDQRGHRKRGAPIPSEVLADVQRHIDAGESDAAIARAVGLHRSTVWQIRKGRRQ